MKQATVYIARKVCGSVRVGGKNPMVDWCNIVVKAAVKMKEVAWKDFLGVKDETVRKRYKEIYKEKKGEG